MITIGGGQVLDASPAKHRVSDKQVVQDLHLLSTGSVPDRLLWFVRSSGISGVELSALVARTGMTPAMIRSTLTDSAKAKKIRILSENPTVAISEDVFSHAINQTVSEVKRFHQTNPLVHGISREELKVRALGDVSNSVFQSVLETLVSEKKIAIAQDIVHEFGRKVTLKQDEEQMRDRIAERFQSLGLQVPPTDELISGLKLDLSTARKIVQLLLKENVLVKISDDIVIHRNALTKLIDEVKGLKAKNPKLGVGEFKELTGVTRKYAIPLLEYLDRQRVTRRVGEDRLIL